MLRKTRFRYFQNGSGELLGFIALVPAIFALLIAIIIIVKMTSLRQKMEYTAYVACRAAALSDTQEEAQKNAEKVVGIELGSYEELFDIKGFKVEIKPFVPGKYTEPEKIKNIDTRTGKEIDSEWKKGNFVDFTLTVYINNINVFLKGVKEKECRLYMAIEKETY